MCEVIKNENKTDLYCNITIIGGVCRDFCSILLRSKDGRSSCREKGQR